MFKCLWPSQSASGIKKQLVGNSKTVYWINSHHRSRLMFLRNFKNIYWLIKGNFIGISLDYNFYTKWVSKLFAHVPTFLFTINEFDIVKKYNNYKQVKVILTDLNLDNSSKILPVK